MMMERKQSDQQSGNYPSLPPGCPPFQPQSGGQRPFTARNCPTPRLREQILGSHSHLGAGTRRVVPSRYVAIPRLVRY